MGRHIRGTRVSVICASSVLAVFLLLIRALCAQPLEAPRDPYHDLLRCTRIEIRLIPSTMRYLSLDDEGKDVLSPEEKDHLLSLKTIVCDNPEHIRAFAERVLGPGRYIGPVKRDPRISHRIHITGYNNAERVTSFTLIGYTVHTEDRHEFEYAAGSDRYLHLVLSQVWPFAERSICADNLSELRDHLRSIANKTGYPIPAQWCDAVLRDRRRLDPAPAPAGSVFECPSARTCHYAMNPECKADSPADMVLLFETRAGWNQHGALELFTFDNHDPKGGLVLFNDGTVKFIRTEAELKQLRWK